MPDQERPDAVSSSFLVTFALTGNTGYPGLRGALKRLPHWHCLGQTWLIKRTGNARELFAELEQHLQPDDHLLIVRIGADVCWSTNFPPECLSWLERNL